MSSAIMTVEDIKNQYPPTKYNPLLPSRTTMVGVLPSIKRLVLETLEISPDLSTGDTYKLPSKKVGGKWVDQHGLSLTTLHKIAHIVGINWDVPKILHIDRDSVIVSIRGMMKKPDGIGEIEIEGSKEVDAIAFGEELRFNLEQLAHDNKLTVGFGKEMKTLQPGTSECAREIDRRVQTLIIQVRKHKFARAESGAKSRAISSAIGLKSSFTAEELKRPFVIPRFDFNADEAMKDPALRASITGVANSAASDLYNSSGSGLDVSKEIPTNDQGEATPEQSTAEPTDEERVAIRREEFKSLTPDNRYAALMDIIARKNLLNDKGQPITVDKAVFKKKPVAKQLDNLMWAENQPTNIKSDDDLPF